MSLDGFTPNTLAGCRLWLDAADASRITYTTNPNVATWIDKSPSATTATAVVRGNRTVRYVMTDGHPSVYVDNGSTVYVTSGQLGVLRVDSNIQNAADYTIIAVINHVQTDSQVLGTIYANHRATGETRAPQFGTGDSFEADSNLALYFIENNTGLKLPTANTRAIAILTSDISNLIVFINGIQRLNRARNGAARFTTDAGPLPTIGGAYNFTTDSYVDNRFATGAFHEVIVYNSALSLADRQRVEGYLAQKWNIQGSLASDHPFRNPPISPPISLTIPPIVMVDVRNSAKIIALPKITTTNNANLTIKDQFGAASLTSTITVIANIADNIENMSDRMILSKPFSCLTMTNDALNSWLTLDLFTGYNNGTVKFSSSNVDMGISNHLWHSFHEIFGGLPSSRGAGHDGWGIEIGIPGGYTPINFQMADPRIVARASNYGIVGRGFISLSGPCTVTVTVTSDDGVIVLFNNVAIISNWGLRPAVTDVGSATFTQAGNYPIEYRYCQGGGGAQMILSITVAGSAAISNTTGWLYNGPTDRGYYNFLWTKWYYIFAIPPSFEGPPNQFWGPRRAEGNYNPINFVDVAALFAVAGANSFIGALTTGFFYSPTDVLLRLRGRTNDGVILIVNGIVQASLWAALEENITDTADIFIPAKTFTPIEIRFFQGGGGGSYTFFYQLNADGVWRQNMFEYFFHHSSNWLEPVATVLEV